MPAGGYTPQVFFASARCAVALPYSDSPAPTVVDVHGALPGAVQCGEPVVTAAGRGRTNAALTALLARGRAIAACVS